MGSPITLSRRARHPVRIVDVTGVPFRPSRPPAKVHLVIRFWIGECGLFVVAIHQAQGGGPRQSDNQQVALAVYAPVGLPAEARNTAARPARPRRGSSIAPMGACP